MKRFFAALPLIIVFILMAHLSFAPPLPPASTDGAPLDGFAMILVAVGALYGGYYVRRKETV
tara:strand:+ start:1416 stop:1601 length:186 start_codon:yes stop_codon:yes gene_type:complete